MSKKLYVVETVSIFRMRYAVEDENAQYAMDTVEMGLGDDDFQELSQQHITETITSTREVTVEQLVEIFDADNPHFTDWPLDRKLKFLNRPKTA
jgi:hypothetical protein